MNRRGTIALGLMGLLVGAPGADARGVADTVHNLSLSGPGDLKESSVTQVCVFCHTPHNADVQRGLWNRELPGSGYTVYGSSTTEATLNQPTGASRLCLSCHDGTLALGNLRVAPRTGRALLGPLTGRSVVGTNLADDHPVSFEYDNALAGRRRDLAPPAGLGSGIRLDRSGQMQCTSCHDPHENPYRMFLTVDDRAGELCVGCHTDRDWVNSTHANSQARWNGSGRDPWPDSPYDNVRDNGCQNCHRPHAAPRPARLLRDAQEHRVCLACHDGSVSARDLEQDFLKASAHPVQGSDWSHEPVEEAGSMPRHVTCVDCHNPHKATSVPASAPAVSGRLRGVAGLNQGGAAVADAANEYEVCFKCHGVYDQTTPMGAVRADNTRNVRTEVNQSNRSHHAVTSVGRNPTMSGFEPGYSAVSMVYCGDCHDPHGSDYGPMLALNYEMNDLTPESYLSYELCYKCHNRAYLINDQAGTFPHRLHVQDASASCATCHDAHGSRENEHLINFMVLDPSGNAVVDRSPSTDRREFTKVGAGGGECYLQCHGVDHAPLAYP